MLCRLQKKKKLYDFKQVSRQWYKKFNSFMNNNGFKMCQANQYCYVKNFGNSYIILLLDIDDMLIASAYKQEIDKLKNELSKEFATKNSGVVKQILGVRITRDGNILTFSVCE